jgi:hypothetical protein
MSYKLNQPSKPKFSVFASYRKSKLIIKFPSNITIAIILPIILFFVALDMFWGVNLPVLLPVSIIDELSTMPRALTSSKLNCSNNQGEISCSISGSYLFSKEEKVINDQQGRLLKATQKSIDILSKEGRLISRNDILVLVTEQVTQLNDFLSYRSQLNLSINTNKLFIFNFGCIRGYSSENILICILLYLIIPVLTVYILSGKAYIFDKDIGKLIVLGFCRRKKLFEIQLDKIKAIRLEQTIIELGEKRYETKDKLSEISFLDIDEHLYSIQTREGLDGRKTRNEELELVYEYKDESYKISFLGVDEYLYSISILFIGFESKELEAHKLADAICLYLNLGTYQTFTIRRNTLQLF